MVSSKNLCHKYNILSRVSLIAALLVVSLSVASAEPSQEAITQFVAQKIPGYMKISDLEYKNYKGSAEGTGRSSIVGELVLGVDLFDRAPEALAKRLMARGWDHSEVPYHTKVLGREKQAGHIYRVSQTSGTGLPFSAELIYRETVRGLVFIGDPRYSKLDGNPFSELPSDAIIVGSNAFDRLLADYEQSREQVAALKERARNEIGKVLAGSKFSYVVSDSGVDHEIFILETENDVTWAADKRRQDKISFQVYGKSLWLKEGRWANSSYESGARVDMLIEGSLLVEPNASEDEWSASLEISVPNDSGNGFYNTSGSFSWNGSAFKGSILLSRGTLLPERSRISSAMQAKAARETSIKKVFSKLPEGYRATWGSGGRFEFKTRNQLFDDSGNNDLVTIQLRSLEIKAGEIILTLKVSNDNPAENYLIFLTTNSDERYGEKLYITDNFRKKKYYAKNGMEGTGVIKSFNSSANAYYVKPRSTELVTMRFPMVTPDADMINLYSKRIHGHQSEWSLREISVKDGEETK